MTEEEKFEERKKYNAPFLRVFDYLAKEKMMNLGLISTIIIIRLQGVVGSDLGVYIN